MSFLVTVRFNSHQGITVEVDPTWQIRHLKEHLQKQHSLPASDIRIIFQGRELLDSIPIQHCGLGNNSVLHAVRGKRKHLTVEANTRTLLGEATAEQGLNLISVIREEEEGIEETPSIPAIYRPGYYVFCKGPCQDVRPGKLRVRCAKCRQGTLTVSQDPSCWEDVLVYGSIHGICQAENCDGEIAEFYFRCASHESTEDETAVALDLIRANRRHVPCVTCLTVDTPVLVYPCDRHHTMCLDCFRIYCTIKLNDRAFIFSQHHGYTLPCPAGCEESLIRETHHFRVLGEEQYARYQRFGTEECLLQMGGVLCPHQGCGAGLLPDHGARKVTCVQGCGYEFCRECLEAYHQGTCQTAAVTTAQASSSYHVDSEQAERARWEQLQSLDTIQDTTKPCPQCKVPVEKAGGCMHMKCSRCSFEWCWMCVKAWNRECQGDHWFR